MTEFKQALEAALAGGPRRHHEKTAGQGKLPVRERVERLVDAGSLSEEGLLANWEREGLGADGVVTGLARIDGRPVALMANDPTVKAGSWGPKTVEKILRVQERALSLQVPMVYLVDSAGARITDQVQMFPGRRGAGRIFHNEVRLSGQAPQVCLLLGPSAAGGAYIPTFCDVVIMREGNASMYLGSPRMAEMVIGEKVTLEEMGGAKMHTGVSGCGHFLVGSDEEAIDLAKRYLSYMPGSWREQPPAAPPLEPASDRAIAEIVPADENQPFDMQEVLDALLDAGTFLEVHGRWAKELIVGYGRLDGHVVGVVANQPKHTGGVLFVDSADKAARFIQTCNAFNLPLLFLADVPGFMIGAAVERQGIIRHGAKMISAVGPSGCGKTTLMRAVVGVQIVEAGRVEVLGEAAGSPALRRRVGYVTQAPSVYRDLSVRDNLRYFARVLAVGRERIEEAIETVALGGQADQVVSSLSGGQQARASLATALLGAPDLLVLDEPTVGLDPVLRRDLWATFRSLAAAGTTLLVSSHVMDEAEHCDELLLMREGELLAAESPGELRERTGQQRLDAAFLALIEERGGAG